MASSRCNFAAICSRVSSRFGPLVLASPKRHSMDHLRRQAFRLFLSGAVLGDDEQITAPDAFCGEARRQGLRIAGGREGGAELPRRPAFRQPRPQAQAAPVLGSHDQARLHADREGDAARLGKVQPFQSDELPIGQQELDRSGPGQGKMTPHQCDALLGIAVARLVRHRPHQGHPKLRRRDRRHQNVDVARADLPVRPLKAQMPGPGQAEEPDDEGRRAVRRKADVLKAALQPSIRLTQSEPAPCARRQDG